MEESHLNQSPLVSICIPCFNAEKYIADTLNCILRQSYNSIEIIVVNDHSTDGSENIISELADQNRQIRFENAQKRGAAAARNQAFRASKGEYIVFFDADDLIPTNFIATQMEKLNFNNNDCVVSAWGRLTTSLKDFQLDVTQVSDDLSFYQWITHYWTHAANMTVPGRVLMHRNLVEKSGYWDEKLSLNDDFQFFSAIFSQVDVIRYNENAALMYRSNIGGLSSRTKSYQSQLSNLSALLYAIDIALEKFNDLPIKQACVNLLQNLIFDSYPKHQDLQKIAVTKIKKIGVKPSIIVNYGGYSKIASRLVGWKLVKQIKYFLSK